jgi:membrane protease YdiL (CAAX protease family)
MEPIVQEIEPRKRIYTWSWLDLILITLSSIAIILVGIFVYFFSTGQQGFLPGESAQPDIALSITVTALEALALIASVYFFAIYRRKISLEQLGLRPLSLNWSIALTLITLAAIPFAALLTMLVLVLLGRPMENPQLDFLIPEGLNWLGAIVMLVVVGVAAPIGEELVFRGVLYQLLRERWGIWPAIFASSLLFALIHGDIAVGVSAFVLGLLLALAFEYSRSLWASILVHAINNSVKVALIYILLATGLSDFL